jgi:hypothetical protein
MIISLLLYCLLGAVLAGAGINILDKPWQFLCIMAVVAFIDLNSKHSS